MLEEKDVERIAEVVLEKLSPRLERLEERLDDEGVEYADARRTLKWIDEQLFNVRNEVIRLGVEDKWGRVGDHYEKQRYLSDRDMINRQLDRVDKSVSDLRTFIEYKEKGEKRFDV